VIAVFFPASKAPSKTKIPKSPGIKDLRMMPDPKAVAKEGAVPLPPMFNARNMATSKGSNRPLNIKSGKS
jgi:hypothetical protein